MESTVQDFFTLWVRWHYKEMVRFWITIWKNSLAFAVEFFSIPFLLKTFFYPWHRYGSSYPSGLNVGEYIGTFIYNIFSRVVGSCVRLFLIVFGLALQILISIVSVLIIAAWYCLPLIIIVLVVLLFVPLYGF